MVENLGDNIDFKVVCSDRDYLAAEPYPNIPANQWVQKGKAQVKYLSPERQAKKDIKKIIEETQTDCIYINGLFSLSFSIYPLLEAQNQNKRIILAPRGMLAKGALSIKPLKKKVFLTLANTLDWYNNVLFHATSDSEAKRIKTKLSKGAQIDIIPNLPSPILPKKRVKAKYNDRIHIVSLSRVAKEKNTLYLVEVLSKLPKNIKVEAHLYGEVYDAHYFEKCKSIAETAPPNVEINFKDVVSPEKLPVIFENADLFFMPTLGENYGHAIIESLLSGTPVLISDQTPWINLEQDGLGKDIPLDNQEGYVDFIKVVAKMDEVGYKEAFGAVSENARKRVELEKTIDGYIRLLS
jgi:glycosyltransferase involved in cell wall biosynthesis